MTPRPRVTLNHGTVRRILSSTAMQRAVQGVAEDIAQAVADQHLTASSPGEASAAPIVGVVDVRVTDRARASVTIRHPAGIAMEAKHGVLSKAASATGHRINRAPS